MALISQLLYALDVGAEASPETGTGRRSNLSAGSGAPRLRQVDLPGHLHVYDFPKNASCPVSRHRQRGNKPMTVHLQLVQPNNLNRSVRPLRQIPTRPRNRELRDAR